MRHALIGRGVSATAASLLLASSANAVIISNNPVSSLTDVTSGIGLTALDLTSVVTGVSLTTPNSLTTSFASSTFSGTLSVSVFADQPSPGPGINKVSLVYEFTQSVGPDRIDRFVFGRDGAANLDFGDLLGATHGVVGDLTTSGQLAPTVDLVDNSASSNNDNLIFDYLGAGDQLEAGESLAWYMIFEGGDIAIDVIEAQAIDFTSDTFNTLGVVLEGTQPDLNVPAPGALVVLAGGGLAAARRRRR